MMPYAHLYQIDDTEAETYIFVILTDRGYGVFMQDVPTKEMIPAARFFDSIEKAITYANHLKTA